jgi:hypothetical protein
MLLYLQRRPCYGDPPVVAVEETPRRRETNPRGEAGERGDAFRVRGTRSHVEIIVAALATASDVLLSLLTSLSYV